MIALVKRTASEEQLAQLVRWIEARGLAAHVSRGADVTIVGLVGDTTRIDPLLLESMDLIERVQRVSEPFKLAGRSFHPVDTVVDCGRGVLVGGDSLSVVVAPHAVDATGFVKTARAAKEAGATLLSDWAPPSPMSPYASAQRLDLNLMLETAATLDMPAVCEVTDARDVSTLAGAGVDVLRVCARNAQNVALLRELGQTRTPVLLERGMGNTIDESLMAAEHVLSGGNANVILCERGTRSFERRAGHVLDVSALSALRRLTHLPVLVDASQAAGLARRTPPVAYGAVAAGASGISLLAHACVGEADGDAAALTPTELATTVRRLALVREAIAADV